MFEEMTWLGEPAEWRIDDDGLAVTSDDGADFWRAAAVDRDSGHLLHRRVEGDFTATVAFTGGFTGAFDQAGLMLRGDERTWLKAGVEVLPDGAAMSAVLTRGLSDWSIAPLPAFDGSLAVRATRIGDVVRVFVSEGDDWRLHRLAVLPLGSDCLVGPMVCSPRRAGLTVRFSSFTVEPAVVTQP